jgi:hypothetical protein
VPIFDARQVEQNIPVDFGKLDDIFPRFTREHEVPIGSCVAVGHSVSTYIGKKDDEERFGTKIHLTTNVLFVVILGAPLL